MDLEKIKGELIKGERTGLTKEKTLSKLSLKREIICNLTSVSGGRNYDMDTALSNQAVCCA